MLATPPIHAPLEQRVYPPPRASISNSPAPLHSASLGQAAYRTPRSDPHRHAKAARDALELVKRLADQVDGPTSGGEGNEGGQGCIIGNLEARGWEFQTTTSEVRIFHGRAQDILGTKGGRVPTTAPQEQIQASGTVGVRGDSRLNLSRRSSRFDGSTGQRLSTGPASRGLRADEALPFFRGEGWIEGSWRREDVVATIASLGARAVWDPWLDSAKSQVIQHLSETDSLAHLTIKSNLVSSRDACIVTTSAGDDRPGKASNTSYIASTSVEDPLIPRTGTRTTIHINAFALRSLPQAPDFEPCRPPPSEIASPPLRPAHRRTRSTAPLSNSALLGTIPLPPLPSFPSDDASSPPQRPQLLGSATHIGALTAAQLHPAPPPLVHAISNYTSATSSTEGPAFYPPFIHDSERARGPAPKRGSVTRPHFQGPGLAVSMVVHASPGYNLPQTTVNQLSLHLPLSIASIGRFLATHGFAPHIVRSCSRIHVREEEFDAQAGRYRVVFTVADDSRNDGHEARVRFFGGTFGKGRFSLEVENVDPDAWRLDFDVPPVESGRDRLDQQRTSEEIGTKGSGLWRSLLRVATKAAGEDGDAKQGRRGSAASLLSPIEKDDFATQDPALVPGTLGGCTLVIPSSATRPYLPVVVSITRTTSEVTGLPLIKMRGMSTALAQAAQVALDDHYSLCRSVEELLEYGQEGSEERAEVCLRGARSVLRELEVAREREAAEAAAAAAAAAFAAGRRRRSSSAGSTRPSLSISPNSPFQSRVRPVASPISPATKVPPPALS
ncbi:hypothetical protein JCM10296v2_004463 [Rhodotorula toruloides]